MAELDPRATRLIRREVWLLVGVGILFLSGLNILSYFALVKDWVKAESRAAAESVAKSEVAREFGERTGELDRLKALVNGAVDDRLKASNAAAVAVARLADVERAVSRIETLRDQINRADATLARIRDYGDTTDGLTRAISEDLRPLVANEVREKLQPMPVGTIAAWLGSVPPPGWEICRGQLESTWPSHWQRQSLRSMFPKGALPDLRGYFLRGADCDGNELVGVTEEGHLPSHAHAAGDLFAALHLSGAGLHWKQHERPSPEQLTHVTVLNVDAERRAKHDNAAHFVAVGGTTAETRVVGDVRPRNVTVHWIIRVQ